MVRQESRTMLARPRGVILNGGRGRRLGFVDKGQVLLSGIPLLEHVRQRLRDQTHTVCVNVRADSGYAAVPERTVFADDAEDVQGPAAGLLTALQRWPDEWILTVAVDMPLLPWTLGRQLAAGLAKAPGAACAYASGPSGHALAILWRPAGALRLRAAYDAEGPRIGSLLRALGTPVAIPGTRMEDPWMNVNTPRDLALLAARLGGGCRAQPGREASSRRGRA